MNDLAKLHQRPRWVYCIFQRAHLKLLGMNLSLPQRRACGVEAREKSVDRFNDPSLLLEGRQLNRRL